jgi:two-component system, OmpR family, heavy metal sensor histidine kinase CusS
MKFVARNTADSLATRATFLLALVACLVTAALGMYFYQMTRTSMNRYQDLLLISRVEHFRRLVGDRYTVAGLRDRPVLSETMLGAEHDVLLLRQPGGAPFIQVNPQQMPVPELTAVALERPLALGDVLTQTRAGIPVHWVAAIARSGEDGEPIEIVAGHPFLNEMGMVAALRDRVVLASAFAMLAATLLAYTLMRRGLRPLRELAAKAEQIGPINLAARLDARRLPSEVRQMVEAVNAMLDRIAFGYERLSQFSADLAHEIRTPIGALIGQTQVALRWPRSADDYRETLESNLEELNRLRSIAENILFLAQADHATLSVERRAIPLRETLQKIADYFEGLADENGLRFEIVADGVVHAEPALCQRAINNLVINAVRHATKGTTVRLSGTQDPAGATITVENEGALVSPEHLGRFFDRFYRGDAARTHDTESNGLGLAIVKAILILHGGAAEVSCPAPGSIRFELRFPDLLQGKLSDS